MSSDFNKMASYDVLEVTGRGDREIGASGTFISSPPSEHIPPELQQRNLTHPHETSNTQLPSRRDAGFEDPRVRLAQVESDLGREQYAHEGTRIELRSTKRSLDATMVELNSTKTELESTKIGLESTKQSLEETRARWKGIVKEFNHFQAQSRKFVQLDDQVLLQKVSQLRFNIRNCILEHFEGNQPILTKDMDALWKYVSSFQPKHIGAPFQSFNELEATVQTPARRIIFLRSFLWLFLTVDILGQSLWAGKTIAGGYHKIGKAVGESLQSTPNTHE